MGDLYGSPLGGGLMGMFANPNTAGLLGMAGGLLQASGPSRLPISNGQALGMGLSGMGEGFNNALQMQRGLMQMRMLQGLMGDQGGGAQQAPSMAAPASASQPMAPTAGAANVGPLSGLSSGMGGFAPTPAASAASASAAFPAASSGASGGILMGKTPAQMFHEGQIWNMISPGSGNAMIDAAFKYDPTLAAQMPTDTTKMALQGGLDAAGAQAANRAALQKANYIAPTALRTPIYFDPMTGTTKVVPADQLAAGYGAQYGAEARAKADYQTPQVYDANAFGPGKGGMVYQTQTNVADAARGGTPGVPSFTPFQNAIRTVESGGNPAAVNPASGAVGSMQTLPTTATNPGFGVTPARDNSPAELQRVGADYATAMQKKYGNDTDAAVAYNWGPDNADKWIAAGRPWKALPPQTQAYVGQVMTQMQNYGNGTQSSGPKPMAAQAPFGTETAAKTSQGAPAHQMDAAYSAMSNSDTNYQASREALQTMLGIAQNGGIGDTAARLLPGSVATRMSNDAAEYEKAHANFVALQGKAMGAAGTDASRATMEAAVPTFDKPQQAKIQGLTNQLQQLDMAHLKTQFLQPIYQAGDEKAFSNANAGFDQNITPQMTPILQLSGPQQRAAVQAAIKQNPALRSKFEWAFNNGMLK